jgi:hypothetical protein
MAAVDEARAQLIAALAAWDYSSAYPNAYTDPKAPIIVPASPPDILANITTYRRDQQTSAILSVALLDISDTFRTLGDHLGPGAGQLQRYGTRVDLAFTVIAWADQQAGGPDLCQKLAGQVEGCVFYNRARLLSYRHLRSRGGHETYEDRPGLWTCDVTVIGDGVASYDA